MRMLEKVGELSRDLLKRVEKEKLLNGIEAVRNGNHLKITEGNAAASKPDRTSNTTNGGIKNFSQLQSSTADICLPATDDNRHTGISPRESPLYQKSCDEAVTDSKGNCSLRAPAVGSYVIRCYALGYFPQTSEIVRLTQPRRGSSEIHTDLTFSLFPKLRKVKCALFDPDEVNIDIGESHATPHSLSVTPLVSSMT